MTHLEALEKLKKYCAYQDRCHQEVRTKLLTMKVYGDALEQIIASLIEDGYLNELRYAENFSRGKYRIKKWGKNKIKQALRQKGISDYCVKKGLAQIDLEEDYTKTLNDVLSKYINQRIDKYEKPLLRKKAYAYGINRGFESALVVVTLDRLKA
jgi:Uncharacterized protein conserved in bacteria